MRFTTTFFEYPFVRYLPYFLYTRVPDVEKAPSTLISPFTGFISEHGCDMRYPLPSYNIGKTREEIEKEQELDPLKKIREHLEIMELIRELECPFLHEYQKKCLAEAILENKRYRDSTPYTPNLVSGLNTDDQEWLS